MIGGDDNEEGFKFMVFCDSEVYKELLILYPIKTAILSKSINTYYKIYKADAATIKENK